jgi:hypothetical protein
LGLADAVEQVVDKKTFDVTQAKRIYTLYRDNGDDTCQVCGGDFDDENREPMIASCEHLYVIHTMKIG